MLTITGLSKRYGSVKALDDVSVTFKAGSIHGVLGENGAGKSTLMHALAGFARPDSGTAELSGKPVGFGDPMASRRLGIAMIHQHFTLVPGFTVEENLVLPRLSSFGPINVRSFIEGSVHKSQELGWPLDLTSKVAQLPVGKQQQIEILKCISGDFEVAIFDEPTAVLGQDEVDDLFRVLRQLKEAGKVVILIAHKLREVMAVCDRVTVLRRGKVVAEAEIESVTPDQLAVWMVGELPPQLQSGASGRAPSPGLKVRGLTAISDRGQPVLRGIDLDVNRGEILGIGGVDGNGQVELAEVLADVRNYGGDIQWNQAYASSVRVAYIPQDRQSDGLAIAMSVADNLMIAGYRRPGLTAHGFIRRREANLWTTKLIQRFGIKVESNNDPVSSLSGGNQQKVVVARALDQTPDLLIAVNPSRGLDVQATEFVHRTILKASEEGAAVVLISTDPDELAALSHRILYLSRGQIVEGSGAVAVVGGLD